MKIITVANQKGGAGKTTTAGAIAAALRLKGFKVLTIDTDAQGNLSHTYRAKADGLTALELLTNEADTADIIQQSEGGDIIPACKTLSGADLLVTSVGKEYRLKEGLQRVSNAYDYCVIDTPPALSIVTVNALVAADIVVIPAQADIYSLQGVEQLAETIKPVKKYCNPALRIGGILLTRYNPRAVLSREVAELAAQMAERIGTRVFSATIREAVTVKESQISQTSLFDYAPRSKAAADYMEFIDELLKEV